MLEVPSTALNFSGTQPPASTNPTVSLRMQIVSLIRTRLSLAAGLHVQPSVREALSFVSVAVLGETDPCEQRECISNDFERRKESPEPHKP